MAEQQQAQRPIPGGANTPKPPGDRQGDKSNESTNLSNPYGYQSNGKKKHRDMTPI